MLSIVLVTRNALVRGLGLLALSKIDAGMHNAIRRCRVNAKVGQLRVAGGRTIDYHPQVAPRLFLVQAARLALHGTDQIYSELSESHHITALSRRGRYRPSFQRSKRN